MNWFSIGALVIALLFGINSLFVVRRRRLASEGHSSAVTLRDTEVTKTGLFLHSLFVGALLVGFGAATLEPASAFGALVSGPLGMAAYLIWCAAPFALLSVALSLLGYPAWRSRGKSDA